MTTSRRLLEQPIDSFEREALCSAAMDRGSEQAYARALGAFSGVVAPPVPVTTMAKAGIGALALKGIGIGFMLGVCSVAVTSAVGSHLRKTAEASAATVARVAPSVASRGNEAVTPVQASTATEIVAKDEPRGVHAAAQGSSPPPTVPGQVKPAVRRAEANTVRNTAQNNSFSAARASVSEESPLSREIALLDAARRSIAQGHAAAALSSLDQRERDLPGGVLGPEATLLRVEALLLCGERTNAEALAAGFLVQNPRGPHAERLHRLLGTKIP